mmetsp:Transcript_11664/g.24889  ORF Transcript_11664/g.24889 Transcript_11664/m.24889 type:complete len:526 (+) Transcript_11664:125-1702(+)
MRPIAITILAVAVLSDAGVAAFGFVGVRHPPRLLTRQLIGHSSSSRRIGRVNSILLSSNDGTAEIDTAGDAGNSGESSSKREMLKFAIPALGIYLTNPLLSNIDNAFVGRTVGALGLAALSPATLCIDQALYLFSFLSRAATGLASRAYGSTDNEIEAKEKMKYAAAPAFSVAIFSGVIMSLLYALFAPNILKTLNVDPVLHTSATSYIHWRGAIAWAALAQSILLSLFMVAKDAITPLKIITGAALLNVIGDAALCAWPLQMGCGGAAAATAFATLISSGWMVQALRKKGMMPKLKFPNMSEFRDLMGFTGPLLAITLTRMAGFMNMQRRAMTLGLTNLAGYQLCLNLLIFFILFGEPLSQLAQTKLPSLIDSDKTEEAMATFKSILVLSTFAAVGVGGAAYLTAMLGPGLFSSNISVQAVAKATAPTLFLAVSQTIVGIAVDGAMMASRDFGFMLATGLGSFALQAKLLNYCNTVGDIFSTFTIRLGTYAVLSVGRALLGYGNLGRAIRGKGNKKSNAAQAVA